MTDDAAGSVTESTSVPRLRGFLRQCFPTISALILAVLVCIAAPTALISLHIHENPSFSPIDEPAQYDYVNRIAEGSMPRLGQRLLPSTLHQISCVGVALQGGVNPPCPGTNKASAYIGGGYQYEAQQPPTYYALAVPMRWIAVNVFGLGELTATRELGAFWVSLGLLTLWMAGRVLGLSVKRLAPAILLLACAPVVIYQSSIVSNDAPSIFAGSIVALVAALAWNRPGRWTAPVLASVAFFVTSIKSVDILGPVIVSALFAIMWWDQLDVQVTSVRSRLRIVWGKWWPNGGALLVGGVVSAVGWLIISRKLSIINPKDLPSFNILRQTPIGVIHIASEAISLLNPLNGSFSAFRTAANGTVLGTQNSLDVEAITGPLLQYLFLAAGVGGLFAARRRWSHWLGLLSLFFLVVVGVVLGVGIWHTYNADPGLSGRYGLSAAPLLALALVASVRGRWVIAGLWAFSIGLLGLTFWYIFAS
jgi:hypothetical protein